MVDSIQQVPLYKNIYTVLNTIIGGYYNTKYVGIGPYSKVISFNRLEGARFQIGARTTKEFSRRVRLSTYLAYGTRDEDFKGAAEVELMLRRQLLRKLTVTYRNDAIQLSSGVSALSENNILSSIFSEAAPRGFRLSRKGSPSTNTSGCTGSAVRSSCGAVTSPRTATYR